MSGTGSFHQPHGRERRRAALELLHELRDQQGFCALIAQDVDLEGATSHQVQRTTLLRSRPPASSSRWRQTLACGAVEGRATSSTVSLNPNRAENQSRLGAGGRGGSGSGSGISGPGPGPGPGHCRC
eukprot:COSAG04_NODE_8046_length_1030_cov_1.627282_2_plen_127_part_00